MRHSWAAGRAVFGFSLLAASVWCLASVSPAEADPLPREARIESARGVSLGTGVRAGSASTQAQADNPANLPLGHLAHIETLFSYQPQLKSFSSGASVVDAMTSSKLAAGLSSRWLFGESSGWEGRAGLGVPIGDMLSIGVAGRYANFTIVDPKARAEEHPPKVDDTADADTADADTGDDAEPVQQSAPKPDHNYRLNAFTLDASITLRLMDGLSISALGYNLVNTQNTKSTLAPMLVGGSVAFGKGSLSLGGDVLVDLNMHDQYSGAKLQVGGGLEYLTQGVAPLRIGYLYDQGRHQQAISAGLGYLDTKFSIQLSLRQYVAGAKDTTLFSAIQYFVQ